MKKITFFAAALSMMAMTAVSCSSSNKESAAEINAETQAATDAELTAPVPAAEAVGVIDLKDDNMFRPDTKVSVPTVLDFNAVWCVPCKKLAPAFHQAAENFAGKINFYSVDIDSCRNTAEAFKVQSVPTVAILTPSGEIHTYVGLGPFLTQEQMQNTTGDATTEAILAKLTEMLNALQK